MKLARFVLIVCLLLTNGLLTINLTKSEGIGRKDNVDEREEKDAILIEPEDKKAGSDDSSIKEGDKAHKISADLLEAPRDEIIKKYTEVCMYRFWNEVQTKFMVII